MLSPRSPTFRAAPEAAASARRAARVGDQPTRPVQDPWPSSARWCVIRGRTRDRSEQDGKASRLVPHGAGLRLNLRVKARFSEDEPVGRRRLRRGIDRDASPEGRVEERTTLRRFSLVERALSVTPHSGRSSIRQRDHGQHPMASLRSRRKCFCSSTVLPVPRRERRINAPGPLPIGRHDAMTAARSDPYFWFARSLLPSSYPLFSG